jgi:transposase-like protein
MSAPRLDKSTKDEIVAAYVAGERTADIAKRFGVDGSYPTLLARRRGIALRLYSDDPVPHITRADRDAAISKAEGR